MAVVEVSDDGGATWAYADARAGRRLPVRVVWLALRVDAAARPASSSSAAAPGTPPGNTQPLEPVENLGGYVNNGVQRVQRDRARLG